MAQPEDDGAALRRGGPDHSRTVDLLSRIKGAASLRLRAVEFGFYHLLLTMVDRVSRLPRNTTMPEAARL